MASKDSVVAPAVLSVPIGQLDPTADVMEQWKRNPMSENWFCSLNANVRSQILKLLDKPTHNVLLRVKGMRDVVLAEPALWREVTLNFHVKKEAEMGAIERIAGFVQKVKVWFWADDMDWMSSAVSHMPQFRSVTEVEFKYGCCFTFLKDEPEKWAPSVLSLAEHFEQVTTLKVSSVFIAQSKSLFETLARRWDSLREVEIGIPLDDDDEYCCHGEGELLEPKKSFGFAQAVAESGKLVSLKWHDPDGMSNNVHLPIRDTLLALATRGHKCLKTLCVTVPKAADSLDYFPLFLLNSLTIFKIRAQNESAGGGESFSKKFLSTLEGMSHLKELYIEYGIVIAEADLIRFLKRARFNLHTLSLDVTKLQPMSITATPFATVFLTTIAETQMNLEKLKIKYDCEESLARPTSAGVSAVEGLPKMKECTIWCQCDSCDERYLCESESSEDSDWEHWHRMQCGDF